MLEKKNHSSLLLVGILLVGVCMRMPITALPSVIKDIAASFQVAPNSLGILTTIPLLCFGFISPLVSLLARKIGNEATIELALLLLIVGSFARIFNFWSLLGGTVLVGLAITGFNVLLPAVIADKLPDKIGSTTGMYNVAITSFSAIGAYTISP
ncbi:MFS transporter, partial [Ligilactobacillus saerimneri]|uniref:MFS transporter n=1 Tax=Ligilactobacillus saerimneri TaxID=228229 RepID=UPI0031199D2C